MCLCCGFLMCAMLYELWIRHTRVFQQQPIPLWAPTIDLMPHPLSQQTSPTPLGCLAPVLKSCSCLAVVDWLPASVFARLSACFSSLTSLQLNSLPFFHWSFQSWNSGGQQWEGNKLSVSFAFECSFFFSWKCILWPRGLINVISIMHVLFDALLWVRNGLTHDSLCLRRISELEVPGTTPVCVYMRDEVGSFTLPFIPFLILVGFNLVMGFIRMWWDTDICVCVCVCVVFCRSVERRLLRGPLWGLWAWLEAVSYWGQSPLDDFNKVINVMFIENVGITFVFF